MTVEKILVPDIGDFADVEIIEVLINVGDAVAVEQSLITLESDKATMEVPSSRAGVITEVLVRAGDKVSMGDAIAVVNTQSNAAADNTVSGGGATVADSAASPSPNANSAAAATASAAAAERAGGDPQQSADGAMSPPAHDQSGLPQSFAGGDAMSPPAHDQAELPQSFAAASSPPMAAVDIHVPDIGDFSDVEILEMLVVVGDAIRVEQPLFTLESDKATMEVPSPVDGVILQLHIKTGDKVNQGDHIATVTIAAESDASSSAPTEAGQPQHFTAAGGVTTPQQAGSGQPQSVADGGATPPPAPGQAEQPQSVAAAGGVPSPASGGQPQSVAGGGATPAPAEAEQPRTSAAAVKPPVAPPMARVEGVIDVKPYAGPAVRRLARELGVNLSQVVGSGKKGRIRGEDVQQFVKQKMTQPAVAAGGGGGLDLPPAPDIDFRQFGEISIQPLSRINKLSAAHLRRCWLTAPHVTQFDEADITDMEEFRQSLAAETQKEGYKMTPLAFFIVAAVKTLRKFPRFNASLAADGENLVIKQYYHIGVAVDTPGGLVVPVLRDADKKGLRDIALELAEMSERARGGALKREDMQGGCFTISSLGGIGGSYFSPIINLPEVAILGVSRAQIKPVWDGNQFAPRRRLPIALSYDHRVIDGAAGARFITFYSDLLGDIRRLAL